MNSQWCIWLCIASVPARVLELNFLWWHGTRSSHQPFCKAAPVIFAQSTGFLQVHSTDLTRTLTDFNPRWRTVVVSRQV
jgi:hypothetical protein